MLRNKGSYAGQLSTDQLQQVRQTSGQMQAVGVASELEESWREHVRINSCYWVSFVTPPIANLDDFYEDADEVFEHSVQYALDFLEREKGCRMRIVDVKITPMPFIVNNDQITKFFCLLLTLPIGHPKKGAKRVYQGYQER